MALSIVDAAAGRAVRELAAVTGESMTEAARLAALQPNFGGLSGT